MAFSAFQPKALIPVIEHLHVDGLKWRVRCWLESEATAKTAALELRITVDGV